MTDPDQAFHGFRPEHRWDYENGFYLTSKIDRMGKLLAHVDLYRSIVGLPGQIVNAVSSKAPRFCVGQRAALYSRLSIPEE